MKTIAKLLTSTLTIALMTTTAQAASYTMLVGTYTDTGSHGIYSYRFDTGSGEASLLDSVAVQNPSYLLVTPDKKNIYAVGENGANGSKVNALSLDAATGAMRLLNSVDSRGADPCHINLIGRTLSVANYSSGSLATFNINDDGTVTEATDVFQFSATGPNPRQAASHIHFSTTAPDGKYVLATNLGGDCIYSFGIERDKKTKTARLQLQDSLKLPEGCGPRHLEFGKGGNRAYVVTELSDEVLVLNYREGKMSKFQNIKMIEPGSAGGGDIHIEQKEGEYLYASERLQNDGIAIYKIDTNGFLKKVGYQNTGIHPRNFMITPDGNLLLCACRDSNVIQVYKIDKKTGLLTHLADKDIALPHPVCVKLVTGTSLGSKITNLGK